MGIHNVGLNANTRNPSLVTIDRARLEAVIASAIDLLDHFDGDPDIEPAGDEHDAAWIEWHTRGRHTQKGSMPEQFSENEDDETVGQEDDFIRHIGNFGPGCPISDPGGCDHDGREEEHEG